jgi:hypothetical protein
VKRRHHSPEQAVRKVAESQRLLGEGKTVGEVAKHLEVTPATRYRLQEPALRQPPAVEERAAAWLVRYLADSRPHVVRDEGVPAVFLATNGERLGATWLTGQVHRYVEASGVGKTGSCHLFRHSAATLMQISDVALTASFDVVRDQGPIRALGFLTVAAAG